MKRMGIRELKAHMSEAISDVREGETIEVTSRGEVVALLVPMRRPADVKERRAALLSLDALAAEIAGYTQGPTDVTSLLGDTRR